MGENISIRINIESWFIPLDILMILCSAFTIIFCIIFLLTIILDKKCHTVSIMLVSNSCLGVFTFGCVRILMTIFGLINDLKQIQYKYSSCIYLGYFSYVAYFVENYSFLQQSIYRYITIIYPTRLYYQSFKYHSYLICLIWIFAFIYPIPHIVTGEIRYDIDNQICQVPFGLNVLILINVILVYIIPILLIILIYIKLFVYVQKMSTHVTSVNRLFRARRELKMVRRLVILVIVVIIIGLPYATFILVSFVTSPPRYHFRIAYIFVDVSMTFAMIMLFQFTQPVKASIMKIINRRNNAILPTMT